MKEKISKKISRKFEKKKHKKTNKNKKTIFSIFIILGIILLFLILNEIRFLLFIDYFDRNAEKENININTIYVLLPERCQICNEVDFLAKLKDRYNPSLNIKVFYGPSIIKNYFIKKNNLSTYPVFFFNSKANNLESWKLLERYFFNSTLFSKRYYILDNNYYLSPKELINKDLLKNYNFINYFQSNNLKAKNEIYFITDFTSPYFLYLIGDDNNKENLSYYDNKINPVLNNLKKESETNDLDLSIKLIHYPTNNINSIEIHKIFECSKKIGIFDNSLKFFIENNDKILNSVNAVDYFKNSLVKDFRIDKKELNSCLSDPNTINKINNDIKLVESLTISGSPSFIINNIVITSFPRDEDLKNLLIY